MYCSYSVCWSTDSDIYAGYQPEVVNSIAFDTLEEAIWTGTQTGALAVLSYSNGDLYARRWAHMSDVLGLAPIGGGAASISAKGLKYHTKGLMQLSFKLASEGNEMLCMSSEPHGNSNACALLADSEPSLQIFDLRRERESSKITVPPESTPTALTCNSSGKVACGTKRGEIIVTDPRAWQISTEMQSASSIKAFTGKVTSTSMHASMLVACGQLATSAPDMSVKVFDLRSPARPIRNFSYQFGVSEAKLFQNSPPGIAMLFPSGLFSTTGSVMNPQAMPTAVDTAGTGLTSFDVSYNGNAAILADGGGYIHLYSKDEYATAAEANIQLPPVETHISCESTEHSPAPPLPFNGDGTHLLSDKGDIDSNRAHQPATTLPPRVVDQRVWASLRPAGIVSCAPNPLASMPSSSDSRRRLSQLLNRRDRAADYENETPSGVPAAYTYVRRGEDSATLPSTAPSAPFTGLENQLPSCYSNALLQCLNFNPVLRANATSHICGEDACLKCELGFLMHMLRKAPPNEPCQPQNLLRALRQKREASSLGLLDSVNNGYGTMPCYRRAAPFQRFVLEQIHKDDCRRAEEDSSGSSNGRRTIIDQCFGLKMHHTSICLQCGEESAHTFTSFQAAVSYEKAAKQQQKEKQAQSSQLSFSTLLKQSLVGDTNVRAFCSNEQAFKTMKQSRTLESLPDELLIHCLPSTADELDLLVTSQSDISDADSDKEEYHNEFWLPSFICLVLHKNGGDMSILQGRTREDIECQATNNVSAFRTYQLSSLVSMIRRAGEDGHLVSHINVGADHISQTASAHAGDDNDEEASIAAPGWYLFNDTRVTKSSEREAKRLYGSYKVPCVLQFRQIHRMDPPPLTDDHLVSREWFMRLCETNSSRHVVSLTEDELKEPLTLGLDAEFVELSPPEKEVRANGKESTFKPPRLGLARVSLVRADGEFAGTPCIDDFILPAEPVHDHLTRFSGLRPGDLDPAHSSHSLVTLKQAYLKLRHLNDSGARFLGHGLANDFKMVNMVVPRRQIVDTSELFRLGNSRTLSLKYLAGCLLQQRVQSLTHDSVEDANVSVSLVRMHSHLRAKGRLELTIKQLYKHGQRRGFEPTPELMSLFSRESAH